MDGAATLSDERLLAPVPEGQVQFRPHPHQRLSKLGAGRSEAERLAALMLAVQSSDGESLGPRSLDSSAHKRKALPVPMQRHKSMVDESENANEEIQDLAAEQSVRASHTNSGGKRGNHRNNHKRRPGHRRSSSVGDYAELRKSLFAAESNDGANADETPQVPISRLRAREGRVGKNAKSKSMLMLPRTEDGGIPDDSPTIAQEETGAVAPFMFPPTRRPKLGATTSGRQSPQKRQASSKAIPRRSPEPVLSGRRDVLEDVAEVVSGRQRADSSTMVVAKNGRVKGATTSQLVDFILARVADPMVERFLASFPHFIDTVVVWQIVVARYYSSQRRAVMAFLRLWIAQALHRDFLFPQFRDVRNEKRESRQRVRTRADADPSTNSVEAFTPVSTEQPLTPGSLYSRLVQFLDSIPVEESRPLKLLILKTKQNFESRLRVGEDEAVAVKVAQESFSRKASRFFRAEDRGPATTFSFTNDVEPRIWAEQLTLIEWDMFARLEDTELYQLAWKQEDKEALAPNVCRIVQRFNQTSFWTATKIVMGRDLKDRVRVIKKFVEMADECLSLGNFNTLMEILGGINTWAIQRLKQTWEAVPAHTMKRLEEFNNLMDSRHNYRAYREALASFSPALPYLGVYLRDLTFIGEGNPDLLGRGNPSIINFEKIMLMGEVIRDLQKHRLVPYEFQAPKAATVATARQYEQSLKQLRAYLHEVYGLREELLYKHSLFCEPSQEYGVDAGISSKSSSKNLKGAQPLMPLLDKGIRGAITDALERKVLKSMLLNHGAKDVAQAQEAAHKRAGKQSPLDTGSKIPVRVSSYCADLRAQSTDVNLNPIEWTTTLINNTGLRLRYKIEGDAALISPEYLVAIEPTAGLLEKGKSQTITIHAVAFAETHFSHVFEIATEVELPFDQETQESNQAHRRWSSHIFMPVKFNAPVTADGTPQFWQLHSSFITNMRPFKSATSGNIAPVFIANLWGMDVLVRQFAYEQRPPSAFRKEVETATWEKQHNANASFLGAFAEKGIAALVFIRHGADGATAQELAGAPNAREQAYKKKTRILKNKLATAQLSNSRLRVYRSQAKVLGQEVKQLKAEVRRLQHENHVMRQTFSGTPDLGALNGEAPSSGNLTSTTSESEDYESADQSANLGSKPSRKYSSSEEKIGVRARTSSRGSSSGRSGRLAQSIELPADDARPPVSIPRNPSRSERAISTTTNESSGDDNRAPRHQESASSEMAGNPFEDDE